MTVVAGLFCYLLFYNRGLGLSVIGYSIAPAERVMQGEVPYRDFLFNYTPGILWLNALLMKIFGVTLMTTRIGLLAFKLGALILLFGAGRRLTNGWVALVPVGLTLSWLGYGQVFNVYPDQYLMPFGLAGLICMLKYDSSSRLKWLVLCGLMTGAVFLFKHNVGVLLAGAATVAVAMRELIATRRIRPSLRVASVFVAAFGTVVALLVAYLLFTKSLSAMVAHFLHHAAEYSESRSASLPPPDLLLPVVVIGLAVFGFAFVLLFVSVRALEAYMFMILVAGSIIFVRAQRGDVPNDAMLASVAYLPPALFFGTLLLMLWQLIRNRRDLSHWWSRNGPLVITGLFALAIYLEVFPRADYYHLVRVLPPVFLFLVVCLYRTFAVLNRRMKAVIERPAQAAMLTAAIPVVFLVAIGLNNTWAPEFDSSFHFNDKRELAIARGKGLFVEERQAELTEGLVKLIEANSSPDDYIFSFAQRGSALYFLANRRNPTRFLWWRSVGISSDEREAVMAMIADRRAKLIVVQDVAANKEIQDFISDNYEQVGTVADIAVYGLRLREGEKLNAGDRKPGS